MHMYLTKQQIKNLAVGINRMARSMINIYALETTIHICSEWITNACQILWSKILRNIFLFLPTVQQKTPFILFVFLYLQTKKSTYFDKHQAHILSSDTPQQLVLYQVLKRQVSNLKKLRSVTKEWHKSNQYMYLFLDSDVNWTTKKKKILKLQFYNHLMLQPTIK